MAKSLRLKLPSYKKDLYYQLADLLIDLARCQSKILYYKQLNNFAICRIETQQLNKNCKTS